jgi:hypothetical protein
MAPRSLLGGIQKLLIDALDPERPLDSETPAVGAEIGALAPSGPATLTSSDRRRERKHNPVAQKGTRRG